MLGAALHVKHANSFNPLPRLNNRYYYPHFTHGLTEGQRDEIPQFRSHRM